MFPLKLVCELDESIPLDLCWLRNTTNWSNHP